MKHEEQGGAAADKAEKVRGSSWPGCVMTVLSLLVNVL